MAVEADRRDGRFGIDEKLKLLTANRLQTKSRHPLLFRARMNVTLRGVASPTKGRLATNCLANAVGAKILMTVFLSMIFIYVFCDEAT